MSEPENKESNAQGENSVDVNQPAANPQIIGEPVAVNPSSGINTSDIPVMEVHHPHHGFG